jgi:hypothetical protein
VSGAPLEGSAPAVGGRALFIVQVVTRPQRRGAELFSFQLSEQLRRLGHRVRIVYLYRQDRDPLPLGSDDIELAGCGEARAELLPGFQVPLLRRLVAEIGAFAPDVVQANGSRSVKYVALATLFDRRRRWKAVYRNIGDPERWSGASGDWRIGSPSCRVSTPS